MFHTKDALKIEQFCNDEDLDFQVASKRAMLPILQGIADQASRITLYYGSDQHFIMTTLLGANEQGMWLAVGTSPQENKQLLLSEQITFVSVCQHVKIQFTSDNIENGLFGSHAAFYMELPDYLLRIQRRDFYRAAVPSTARVKCIIPIQPENPGDPVIIRAVPIVNISGGGVGLLCGEDETTLLPMKTFPGCQISLPDIGTLTATLEVRNSINFITPNNVAYKRVGCRFVHLTNKTSLLLQHYITNLQSESMTRDGLAVL